MDKIKKGLVYGLVCLNGCASNYFNKPDFNYKRSFFDRTIEYVMPEYKTKQNMDKAETLQKLRDPSQLVNNELSDEVAASIYRDAANGDRTITLEESGAYLNMVANEFLGSLDSPEWAKNN